MSAALKLAKWRPDGEYANDMSDLRSHIVAEIKRVAAREGRAPGRVVFERETGIRVGEWQGVFWARWGDALVEAGFAPNEKNARLDPELFLEKLAQAFRHFGRVPTTIELRLYRQVDAAFPAHSSLDNHFRTKSAMLAASIMAVGAAGILRRAGPPPRG